MTLSEQIAVNIKQISKQLGEQVITWSGEDYEIIPSSVGRGATLEEGGFSIEVDLTVTLLKELFSEVYPVAQEKITFNEVEYRIVNTRTDSTDTFIRLFCNSVNRGV